MIISKTSNEIYDTWMYAERYLGGGTRTYSAFSADSNGSRRYAPSSGAKSFKVKTFLIPREAGTVNKLPFGKELQELYFYEDYFLLPVHPEVLDDDGYMMDFVRSSKPGPDLNVVPSASLRTVFVLSIDGRKVKPHFVKLHYSRRLSRFRRRLRRQIIDLQLWVSSELYRGGIPFLPEVGAAVVGSDPEDSWGFVIRDAVANVELPENYLMVPLFALYGSDLNHEADPSLLSQLIDSSGQDSLEWADNHIVRPLVSLWVDTAQDSGILLEPHGQNTMLAFDRQAQNTNVIYRDCGVYILPGLRKNLPHDYPKKNVIGTDVAHPDGQMTSLIYDSFLCHHMLAYIAAELEKSYGLKPGLFEQSVRQAFHEKAGPIANFLPDEEYYYTDKLKPNNEWNLKIVGKKPKWR